MSKVKLGALILGVGIFLYGCGGMWAMKEVDEKASPKAKSDKAVLVIMRTTSYGFAVTLNNYLDGKIIGQTKGKSYFFLDVEPGIHTLIGKNENSRLHKINFEAGKIYFLQQAIYMGAWSARTEYDVMTPQQFEEQKDECNFLQFTPEEAKDQEDAVVDVAASQKERDENMKEEAEYFNKIDNVKGY